MNVSSDELKKLKDYYLSTFTKKVKQITEIIKNKDKDELINFGHKLKGSGISYGFQEISDIGKDIENLKNDFSWEKAEELSSQLFQQFQIIEKDYSKQNKE